jgi:hypothetical protein
MNRKRAFVAALLLTLAAFGAVGCAADDCSRAGDRLVQCVPNVQPSSDAFDDNYKCVDPNLCKATCVNSASCDELADAYSGTPTDKSRNFIKCVDQCPAK